MWEQEGGLQAETAHAAAPTHEATLAGLCQGRSQARGERAGRLPWLRSVQHSVPPGAAAQAGSMPQQQ